MVKLDTQLTGDIIALWEQLANNALQDFYGVAFVKDESDEFDTSENRQSEAATWFFDDKPHNSFFVIGDILGMSVDKIRSDLLEFPNMSQYNKHGVGKIKAGVELYHGIS